MDSKTAHSESFINFKENLLQLYQQINSQWDSDKSIDRDIQTGRKIGALNNQLSIAKITCEQQEQRIRQLQEQLQVQNKECQDRHRREVRKYIELVNEKEHEIEKSKKATGMLKEKVNCLQQELDSMSSAKMVLENTISKSLQNLKVSVKQFNHNIDDSELDKMVLENKYRQLVEKIEQLTKINEEVGVRRKHAEQNYQRVKESYRKITNDNLDLKFQLQRRKLQIEQLKKQQFKSDVKQEEDKSSFMIKVSKVMNLLEKNQTHFLHFKKIKELDQICEELTIENRDLKEELKKKEEIIDKLMIKNSGKYANNILKEREPSLFEELVQKKEKIQLFQSTLKSIEDFLNENSHRIEEAVTNLECQNPRLRELIHEIEKLKEKIAVIAPQRDKFQMKVRHYKHELYEMIQIYELKVKGVKKGQKGKRKIRCTVCFLGQEEGELYQCQICRRMNHEDCSEEHECEHREERYSIYSQA